MRRSSRPSRYPRRLLSAAALAGWLLAGSLAAQDDAPGQNVGRASAWPMDRVTLKDGRRFSGLIVSENRPLEFMEIHRPPGKPMYLIVRPIQRRDIRAVERVSAAERKLLEERVRRFKNRALIEGRRMESVPLERVNLDGTRFFQYEGDWLRLQSTTSEELTRHIVVRVEQILLAFRQVLPPRREAESGRPMRMKVFGTTDQYYQYLRAQKIDLLNPAYFDAGNNLVVAGSDINRFAEQLAAVRARHDQLAAQQAEHAARLPEELKKLNDDLEARGVGGKERRKIVLAAQQKFQRRQGDLQREIALAERRNTAHLDELVEQMLRRLYHEAFHAYLENYVYESARYRVPRWLNEGLAQVFEAGRLEADTLRIDAPLPAALAQLQADLRSDHPLTLAELLSAEPSVFLVPHRGGGTTSARHYLYSWGLAYYLTFEMGLLETEALDQYAAADSRDLSPPARFERLVHMPLAQFEPAWRRYMLELRPPR
jgi:hypothetical protein